MICIYLYLVKLNYLLILKIYFKKEGLNEFVFYKKNCIILLSKKVFYSYIFMYSFI